MQNQNSKITLAKDNHEKVFGITFPLTYDQKDLSKINYTFIKYKGIKKVNENNCEISKHFVEFTNFPQSFIKDIYEMIKNDIEEINNNKSVSEVFKHITNLFNKHKFNNNDEKTFLGDFGEALFMLKVKKELGVDISKYYRSNFDLYDFYINDKNYFLEVKSCSKNNGKIIVNKRQLEESEKKDFYIVEYQFVPGNKTIFDIYDEIGFDNSIIKEKYDKWLYWSSKQEVSDFINKNKTIDLEKVLCFRLNEKLIPKIRIENDQAIEDVKVTLNVSTSRNEGLKKLLSVLNQN